MKTILRVLLLLPSLMLAQTPSPILGHSTQLIVVTTPGWSAVDGQLQRYERTTPADAWKAVGATIPIVVGKNGMGWGIGLATVNARSGGEPIKQEGDRKAPAGIFRLGKSFGYAPAALTGSKVPYLALTPSIECVDDPHSASYNRIVDRASVKPDWNSSEHMRDAGQAYEWGIVIEHNAAPAKPGGGSCVFLHIWGGPGLGTAGCTAMPATQIEAILQWLDPAKNPLLVQLPAATYRQLEKAWHLPRP